MHPRFQENWYYDINSYPADSTILTFQGFEISSPALQLDFQESWKDTQPPLFTCCSALVKGGPQHPRRITCWSAVGAGWPCSSRGWFPAEPWPETSGPRWTAASRVSCSHFPLTVTVPSLHTWNNEMLTHKRACAHRQKPSLNQPCLVERTPVSALLLGFVKVLEFFRHSRALWNQQEEVWAPQKTDLLKIPVNPSPAVLLIEKT